MKTKETINNEALDGQFSFLIGELLRRMNLLNRDQKICYGITLPQCYIIEALERKGLLSMNELSKNLGVTVSTMTRGIDVLVRNEVVERVDSPGDRRKVCIRLTEKGTELAVKLRQCTDAYSRQLLTRIPADKHDQVLESLQLISQAVGLFDQKCCV